MTWRELRWFATVAIGIAVPYLLMAYGGVRSPDCEVVFRAGEQLATTGRLEVSTRLETWPEFGVAEGRDGRLHSIFGPQLSVLSSPLILLADLLEHTTWFESSRKWIPLSFFVGTGMRDYFAGTRPDDMRPHLHRFVASFLNIACGALGAAVMWLIVLRMSRSRATASVFAVLHGLGTLAWPYSGTFFSEPAATTFALLALLFLITEDPHYRTHHTSPRTTRLILSGACLGMSVLAHITSVLFLPFFLAYAIGITRTRPSNCNLEPSTNSQNTPHPSTKRAATAWLLGAGTVLAFLAFYNAARFGNPLETGRTADMAIYERLEYGRFIVPWEGLTGLLFSSGKGLLWYSPAVLVGVACWPSFHRSNRLLSSVLALAATGRIVFIASRSDWHGGFCLGPRYLVPLIPFLLLPAVPTVTRVLQQGGRKVWSITTILFLCVSQQAHLALGEPISYYYKVRIALWDARIVNLFKDNLIYRDWRLSPLLHLQDWRRGPFLLQGIPFSNLQLWFVFVGLIAAFLMAFHRSLLDPRRWK